MIFANLLHLSYNMWGDWENPKVKGKYWACKPYLRFDDKVWNEARFRRANPDYRFDKPCVYVGMTGLDPDLRFDRHKAGIQANRYVRDYGLRLVPELYEVFNPMPYRGAQEMEVELAIALKERGYGVWQG